MKIPCKDCITLPICRNRQYLTTFYRCRLISDYLPEHNYGARRNQKRLELIFKTIKPKNWTIREISHSDLIEAGQSFKGKLMVHDVEDKG